MLKGIKADSTIKSSLNSRLLRWGVGIVAGLVLTVYAASFLFDEPLRRKLEKNINRDLKGYSVRLTKAHLQLLDLSLTLNELTVLQQAYPDPPVVSIPVLKASIHWREIFSGKLVAEMKLDWPNININLQQLRGEAADTASLKERGWQQAVAEIYPLKINNLKISNATITYIDEPPQKPLVLSRLNLQAINIRNVSLPDQVYPSSFHLDTAVFDSGRATVDGKANFLGKPYPGIKGRIMLDKVPLDSLNTLADGSNFSIRGGLLGGTGSAEYAPTVKVAHLETLTIKGMTIDYIHSKQTAAIEKKRAAIVGKTARELSNKPGLLLRADQVSLTECTIGMVNEAARKPYRIYVADTDFQLNNYSNNFSRGPTEARLKGKFMGSGPTTAAVNFRPAKGSPDFDLHLKIGETSLTSLNNMLRSYGDFDVSAGVFSLVSELHVENDVVSGYIKPFFKEITVYDMSTDKDQGVGHQLYEMMAGGVAGVLENRSRQEVATKVNVAGSLKNPQTSRWGIIGGLFKNAFFKAILPSFEK